MHHSINSLNDSARMCVLRGGTGQPSPTWPGAWIAGLLGSSPSTGKSGNDVARVSDVITGLDPFRHHRACLSPDPDPGNPVIHSSAFVAGLMDDGAVPYWQISSYRSRQSGSLSSINSIFQRLGQCLMFLSRWIAAMIESWTSK